MATKIIYQTENPDRFWTLWQMYLDKHKVGPVYLKVNLDFHLALAAERGYLKENRSFVYEIDNEPVACVLLPVEEVDNDVQISMEGGSADAQSTEISISDQAHTINTIVDVLPVTSEEATHSLDSFVATYIGNSKYIPNETISLGSIPAVRYSFPRFSLQLKNYGRLFLNEDVVFIKHSNIFIMLTTDNKNSLNLNLFNKILSTFKFNQ